MPSVCMNPSVRYAQRDITQLAHLRGPLTDARIEQLLRERRPTFPELSRRELHTIKNHIKSARGPSHRSTTAESLLRRYNVTL